MKRLFATLVLAAAMLTAGTGVLSQETAPGRRTTTARMPAMKLHKELEKHRLQIAARLARYTVSVEIDYDRDGEVTARPRFPGAPDLNSPFFRYDLGPFSGLVVDEHHILISDRCLGKFNRLGASDGIEAITVTLPNGTRWPGKVVGRHQRIDLALLKLTCEITKACPVLEIIRFPKGKVSLTRGQQIFVVGRGQNPLRVLVNDGIVSALFRAKGAAFQLDARVGNSTLGAPVMDNQGKLVGLVTLHNHATFGQASGVSYAAYAHEVRAAYVLLKEGKFIVKPPEPFMGVRASKKWPDKPGLEIGYVVRGSGAQRAGLRIGDVILEVDGISMNQLDDLIKHIQRYKVGDTMEVLILRGEEKVTKKVTLGERP